MTGLRTYTTLDPNQWRFPQWKNNIFYPAGSFVAVATYNPLDSEDVTFAYYVSLLDVTADNKEDGAGNVIVTGGSYAPNDSDSDWINHSTYNTNPWALAFDTTVDTINADLIIKIDALTGLFPLLGIDSDVALLFRADSDFRVKDSEQDSDILQVLHDALASDSDYYRLITSHLDSEELARQSADSDLQIQIFDNDSDILMEIHDRKAADSDLQVQIWDNDSDILQRWHDTLGIDSDRDSDILVLHVRDDSDSDRLVNFIKRYTERDSDIALKFDQHDSDIDYLYNNAVTSVNGNTGFPVGVIMAFAGTTMPPGFAIADGSSFDAIAYPELFAYLGENRLPDLRNQFLRGWNNDSDGFGNNRIVGSTQSDQIRSHTHQYLLTTFQDGGNAWNLGGDNDGNQNPNGQTGAVGGDETRPTNVSVVFGISMYTGAGIIYDSEVIESILNIRLRDYDSDLIALYNRTNFFTTTYAPTTDQPIGSTLVVGSSVTLYDDIEVLLNGVQVTQWSAAGTTFTFNFFIRGNRDEIVIKMRR